MKLAAALVAVGLLVQDPDVEREWTIRGWALGHAVESAAEQEGFDGAGPEIARALSAEGWVERHAAMDALARMPQRGKERSEVVALALQGLDDPHPNVRARALVALRRHAQRPLPREQVERLANDALPEVRLELARTLGTSSSFMSVPGTSDTRPVEEQPLWWLTGDADAAVADAAQRAVMARGDAAVELQVALLDKLWQDGADELWLQLALLVARNGNPTRLIDRLSLPAPSNARERSREALVAALSILRFPDGSPFAVNESPPEQRLVDGWLERMQTGDSLERRRREVLLRAARRAGDDVAEALLQGLDGRAFDVDRSGFLLEGAFEALGANGVTRRALELDLDTETVLEMWRRAATRQTKWRESSARPWLAADRPAEVREAVTFALAQALVGSSAGVAGSLLVDRLDDPQPGLREIAIDALTDARRPAAYLDALHADWVGREMEEQQELLTKLSREVPPSPFREDLLQLGEASSEMSIRSSSLIELCQTFVGDDEVGAALERWLGDDLDRLAQRPLRPHELRAQRLLRALHKVLGEDAVVLVQRALKDAARIENEEVAKVCVQVLGRTERGRRTLPIWLREDALQRIRIEAALWIGKEAPSPARIKAKNLLIQVYMGCDGELRARILKKLATQTDTTSGTFLAHIATRDYPLEERGLALSSLAQRRHGKQSLASLAGVIEDVQELEILRRAIEAVGTIGAKSEELEARALLETLWSRHVDGDGAAAQRTQEERELLREELMLALAHIGGVQPALSTAWLVRPFAQAPDELRQRFEGRRGTSTEFGYRAELQVCETLAREGRLGGALSGQPIWIMDARLSLALAERALDAGAQQMRSSSSLRDDGRGLSPALSDTLRAAKALMECAEVGLAGERLDDEGRTLWIRARTRLALLARAQRDWGEAARRLEELLADWRSGRLEERELREVLGRDGATSEEVRALFESGLQQALAWQALELGELDRARALARRARERAGRSESTWDAQRKLEAMLAR